MRKITLPLKFNDYVENSTNNSRSHVACIFRDINPKKIQKFIAYGSNSTNIHAEVDACISFRHKIGRRKINKLGIFVGRFGNKNSRPCWNCYLHMKNMVQSGYNISSVYYTIGSKNKLAKCSFSNLLSEPFRVSGGNIEKINEVPDGFEIIFGEGKKYVNLKK